MTLTDELANALQKLVTAIDGFKNCPTFQEMTVEAKRVLAKWRATREQVEDMPWMRILTEHPDVWQEWLKVGQHTFHLWLQEKHPEVWEEYVGRDE